MDLNKIYSQLKATLRGSAGAELAFGSASRVGDVHIVPVARISFGFGLGGGSGSPKKPKKTKEAESESEESAEATEPKSEFGGGGGGSLRTDPIGMYLISGDKLRYLPVISIKDIFAIGAFICLMLYRIQRLKRKK